MFGSEKLLVSPAHVFEPTRCVFSLRIVMRPVNRTAFFIPDVFTVEAHPIAFRKRVDARRDIDVVRNKHGLT